MPERRRERARLRSFSKTINAPEHFVFGWCTDFTGDDPKLTGSTYERRILAKTRVKCVFIDLFHEPGGRQNVAVNLVVLKPPDRWHLDLFGDPHNASLDFKLTPLARDKTRLDIAPRGGLLDSEIAGLDEVWSNYALEIEKDYKSSKFSVFPTGLPERVHRPSPEGERKLAAIMFTDMAGYTALGQRNESLSLALVEEQKRIIRPIIERHHGREVKTMGDAFLVEFSSALEAVHSAYEIQRATKEFNVPLSADKRIHLRVGIHLGDVIESQGDIVGDAVNVASRIEPLAKEDGVCLTSQVYDQIRSKLELSFVSLGLKDLKNVAEPLEVYRLVMPWEGGQGEVQTLRQLDRARIAVLPFTNLSPDPNDEYFADGMTEELIDRLAHVRGIEVIARTSVMSYKKKEKKVTEIAKELLVGSVVEGSVRKAGNRVRVTAQLVNGETEGHLWSEHYDGIIDDIFAVQSQIAEKVAEELKVQLLQSEKKSLEKKPTENMEAYGDFLRGKELIREMTEPSLREGLKLFERAAELDPSFARAHVGVAECHHYLGGYVYEPYDVMVSAEKASLKRALELDPDLAEAHAALADVIDDIPGSEAVVKRALELDPSLPGPYQTLYLVAGVKGEPEEMLRSIESAYHLDPINPWYIYLLGMAYLFTGREKEALELTKKTEHLDSAGTYAFLTEYYLSKGDVKKARASLAKFEKLWPTHPGVNYMGGFIDAMEGDKEKALLAIKKIEERKSGAAAYNLMAYVYYALGDFDKYFENLDRALEENGLWNEFQYYPHLAKARADPRYGELVRKLRKKSGLPK